MAITIFNNLTEKDKNEAIKNIINDSSPRQDFFLMIILSILMASFGILIDNISVVIGSMLIAPMLYPIMGLSLGVVMANPSLIRRSMFTIGKSTLIGLSAAFLVTLFVDPLSYLESQSIISGLKPSLAYAAIAVVAGLAASFALIKPHMNESLPGIAISVALIPPLATTGIGLARLNWTIASGAALLFLLNIIGISFAAIIVFSLMNLYVKKNLVTTAIKEDERLIKEEIKKAKKERE